MKKKKIISVALSFLLVFSLGVFSPENAKAFADEALNSVKDGLNAVAESLDNQIVVTESVSNESTGNDVNGTQGKILTTNDVHGGIFGTKDASYATVKKLHDEDSTSVLVDAGDHSSGSRYAQYDFGKHMVSFMRQAGYDFAVPGNHEFDVGMDHFYEIKAWAEEPSTSSETAYSYYACNFWDIDNKDIGVHSVCDPYTIIKVNNVDIAFIGIMTPETIAATSPGYFQDENGNYIYAIEGGQAMYDRVNSTIEDARANGAELVVAVGHLGIENPTDPNSAKSLVSNTSGLDAYIDGHSHSEFAETWQDIDSKNIPVVQTGTELSYIGSLSVESNSGLYSVTTPNLIDCDTLKESYDAALRQTEEDWKNFVDGAFTEQVATTETKFPFRYETSERRPRVKDNNLSALGMDAFYWYAENQMGGCDLSFFNGGGFRGGIEKTGTLTYGSCNDVFKLFSEFGVATMSGSVLREALEFSYRNYLAKKDDGTWVENAYLLSVSGIMFNVTTDVPSTVQVDENGVWLGGPTDGFYRVQNISIFDKNTHNYEPIDLNRQYRIAGTTYMLKNLGDGFAMFNDPSVKLQVHSPSVSPDIVLREYLKAFSTNGSNADLPLINSANSPLNNSKYSGLKIDYEDQEGREIVPDSRSLIFNAMGGIFIPMISVAKGEPVGQLQDIPVREGYDFVSWVTSPDGDEEYDFDAPLNETTTVYAKWIEAPQPAPVPDPGTGSSLSGTPQTSDSLGWLYTMFVLALLVSGSVAYNRKRNEVYRNAKHINR